MSIERIDSSGHATTKLTGNEMFKLQEYKPGLLFTTFISWDHYDGSYIPPLVRDELEKVRIPPHHQVETEIYTAEQLHFGVSTQNRGDLYTKKFPQKIFIENMYEAITHTMKNWGCGEKIGNRIISRIAPITSPREVVLFDPLAPIDGSCLTELPYSTDLSVPYCWDKEIENFATNWRRDLPEWYSMFHHNLMDKVAERLPVAKKNRGYGRYMYRVFNTDSSDSVNLHLEMTSYSGGGVPLHIFEGENIHTRKRMPRWFYDTFNEIIISEKLPIRGSSNSFSRERGYIPDYP